MKYFVMLLILIGFGFIYHAYAELDKSIFEPFENSDLVIIGTVIQVNTMPSENKIQYNIKVEEYLKGQKSFDMITAILDETIPVDFPHEPLDYYNRPYFEKDNQVFVYLKQEGATFKMSPYSFTIKKPTVAGPPTVIHPTGPQGHYFSQGDEIVISGTVKKGYLYGLEKSGLDSGFHLVVLNERGEQVDSKKLIISPDGNYKFLFQNKGDLRIPGNYSWEINYENGGMGGEFVVVTDSKLWTPLKQFKAGVHLEYIKCKESLTLITKYDGSPSCVKPESIPKLIERGWTAKNESKITTKDYKIDCNDQINPHQEYECFKNAYSNCDVATVSPEIYTIEGDPVYTTLTITPDCKIHGMADMSTDRFWGTPEIITTQCEKIIDDEYMWAVKNCDAKNLPEMQFNFEMQLYPKIIECEENGNTWSRETLSCINKYDASSESIWKKYIAVSASRNDDPALADALPVYNMVNNFDDEILYDLLFGADGCKEETEVCKISGGISLDRTYSFLPRNIMISDNDQYTTTIDVVQAEQLRAILDWKQSDGSFYSVVHFDGKQYFLTLSTFDSEKTPDVKMDVLGAFAKPVALEKGHALNYIIAVTAWSTYGADAQIDLMAVQDAKDSGIDVWIEPNIITVPERSNATATLFIKAQDNANDGIYDIRVMGHANGKLADLYCRNTVCPTVNIGNSTWSIRTFGSGTNMGIGGSQHPENTWIELELNKNEFFEGDMVEINAYLVNNSTEKIEFVPDTLLIKVIKAQDMGYYDNLYGIDARYESDELLVLEPYSKTLLVRPFYWNQNTFENFDDEQRVDVRQHKMIAKFVGDNYAWNGDMWFEIK